MITRGLIIRTPWVERILAGEKTWEMRTRATKVRGPIALIRAGSGLIEGVATLVDVKGPLSRAEALAACARHRVPKAEVAEGGLDGWPFAWIMAEPLKLQTALPYEHPSGAVIWVTLRPADQAALERAIKRQTRRAG